MWTLLTHVFKNSILTSKTFTNERYLRFQGYFCRPTSPRDAVKFPEGHAAHIHPLLEGFPPFFSYICVYGNGVCLRLEGRGSRHLRESLFMAVMVCNSIYKPTARGYCCLRHQLPVNMLPQTAARKDKKGNDESRPDVLTFPFFVYQSLCPVSFLWFPVSRRDAPVGQGDSRLRRIPAGRPTHDVTMTTRRWSCTPRMLMMNLPVTG